MFPEFVHYDFHNPFKLPRNHGLSYGSRMSTNANPAGMKGAMDHIICDPPFLSEDCQTKGEDTLLALLICHVI